MSKAHIKLFGGTLEIQVEAADLKKMVEQLSFYSALPEKCPVCGGKIGFVYREPRDIKYWGMACEQGHESMFGVYKEESRGLFYKTQQEWKKWEPEGGHDNEPDFTDDLDELNRLVKSISGAFVAAQKKNKEKEALAAMNGQPGWKEDLAKAKIVMQKLSALLRG